MLAVDKWYENLSENKLLEVDKSYDRDWETQNYLL